MAQHSIFGVGILLLLSISAATDRPDPNRAITFTVDAITLSNPFSDFKCSYSPNDMDTDGMLRIGKFENNSVMRDIAEYYTVENDSFTQILHGEESKYLLQTLEPHGMALRILNLKCDDWGIYYCYYNYTYEGRQETIKKTDFSVAKAQPGPVVNLKNLTAVKGNEPLTVTLECSAKVGHAGVFELTWRIGRKDVAKRDDKRVVHQTIKGQNACNVIERSTLTLERVTRHKRDIVSCFLIYTNFNSTLPGKCASSNKYCSSVTVEVYVPAASTEKHGSWNEHYMYYGAVAFGLLGVFIAATAGSVVYTEIKKHRKAAEEEQQQKRDEGVHNEETEQAKM